MSTVSHHPEHAVQHSAVILTGTPPSISPGGRQKWLYPFPLFLGQVICSHGCFHHLYPVSANSGFRFRNALLQHSRHKGIQVHTHKIILHRPVFQCLPKSAFLQRSSLKVLRQCVAVLPGEVIPPEGKPGNVPLLPAAPSECCKPVNGRSSTPTGYKSAPAVPPPVPAPAVRADTFAWKSTGTFVPAGPPRNPPPSFGDHLHRA